MITEPLPDEGANRIFQRATLTMLPPLARPILNPAGATLLDSLSLSEQTDIK
ncbi:hypothetical protein KIL84_005409 [Mauremys mutica]|uniref:Uncharacterized protein n=1 Tax=Mauremys mutica TaxID=74926 RepID=A0A9D3XKQ4_9SAUR|nr:hypothetical protein KIL84_005409 [Mauremys mutica]